MAKAVRVLRNGLCRICDRRNRALRAPDLGRERIRPVVPSAGAALAVDPISRGRVLRNAGGRAGCRSGKLAGGRGAVGMQFARGRAGGFRTSQAVRTASAILQSAIPSSFCRLCG